MILKFWNLPLNVWFFWTLALKKFVTCLSRWMEMRSLRILVPISAWLTFTSSPCTVLSPALVPNAIPGVAHRIPVHTFLPPPSLQGTLGIPRFKTRKDKKHLVKRGVYGGGGWRRKLFYLGLCMVIGKLVTGEKTKMWFRIYAGYRFLPLPSLTCPHIAFSPHPENWLLINILSGCVQSSRHEGNIDVLANYHQKHLK